MDWLDKIPKWIQIPLKILLPALCIFSGFLLLISDGLAEKLYLREFRQQNGFAFGLIFVITLTLILVYLIFFASKPAIQKLNNYMLKKKLIKKFKNLESIYKSVLYQMYKTPSHSIEMELSNAIATYLLNISAVDRGVVSRIGYVFDFYLQPWVIWGIESEIKDAEKFIKNYEKNNSKLQKKDDFSVYTENYEYYKKFLEFINTPVKEEQETY